MLSRSADGPDMGSKGEIRVNQGKRGYDFTHDDQGQLTWVNP